MALLLKQILCISNKKRNRFDVSIVESFCGLLNLHNFSNIYRFYYMNILTWCVWVPEAFSPSKATNKQIPRNSSFILISMTLMTAIEISKHRRTM